MPLGLSLVEAWTIGDAMGLLRYSRAHRPGAELDLPPRTPLRNASHSGALNCSTGPLRSLESRTAIRSPTTATSTHPLVVLSVLFLQSRFRRLGFLVVLGRPLPPLAQYLDHNRA